MPRDTYDYLTIEQCEVLKALGIPQDTVFWYIRQAPNDAPRVWPMPYPWEGYTPEEGEEPLVCEQIVACPCWIEIEAWLGTNINLRYSEEIGLWETHIENGPTATGKERDEAAYNLVLMVKHGSLE